MTGHVVHTHVPLFTKQYKLGPAKGRWCSVAGKVTVGLACDIGLRNGDMHPTYAPVECGTFTFTFKRVKVTVSQTAESYFSWRQWSGRRVFALCWVASVSSCDGVIVCDVGRRAESGDPRVVCDVCWDSTRHYWSSSQHPRRAWLGVWTEGFSSELSLHQITSNACGAVCLDCFSVLVFFHHPFSFYIVQ